MSRTGRLPEDRRADRQQAISLHQLMLHTWMFAIDVTFARTMAFTIVQACWLLTL